MRGWHIALAIALSCALTFSSEAEVRKGQAPPLSTKGKASALNHEECISLGGYAVLKDICTSGAACKTTDQNGKDQYVCISAKK